MLGLARGGKSEQAIWKSAIAPVNLINTVSLLGGLLSELQTTDPGYGTSLLDALKGIGNKSALSVGFETVLLFMEAQHIADLQRDGGPLTSAQETFARDLVTRMVSQQRTALAELRSDFNAFQEANRPTNMAGVYYVGTAPTDAQKQALTTLLPASTSDAALRDSTTIAFRLLTAIGASQASAAQSGSFDVGAVTAGVGIGVPLASALVAIGAGAILASTAATVTASTVTLAGVVAPVVHGGVLQVAAASFAGATGVGAGAGAAVAVHTSRANAGRADRHRIVESLQCARARNQHAGPLGARESRVVLA